MMQVDVRRGVASPSNSTATHRCVVEGGFSAVSAG